MKEAQVKFNNWTLELEAKYFEFQTGTNNYDKPEQYWMHRNAVLYDYEIHRLSQFKNPCRACSLPLHATKNFEVYGTGPVCGMCYTLHSIISAKPYFSALHKAWREDKDRKAEEGKDWDKV